MGSEYSSFRAHTCKRLHYCTHSWISTASRLHLDDALEALEDGNLDAKVAGLIHLCEARLDFHDCAPHRLRLSILASKAENADRRQEREQVSIRLHDPAKGQSQKA